MIEFLCDGLVCPSDYQIYRRNNVLSHLMALYNSPILDEKSKVCITVLTASGCIYHILPLSPPLLTSR